MIGRGVAAVLIGVVGAALINAFLILITSGELPRSVGELVVGSAFVALWGVVLTTPAWILFCLIFLPVTTHRVKIGRHLPRSTYFIAAFLLGAVLIIPLFAVLTQTQEVVLLVPLSGGVGGLSIAMMWSFLVLDIISPSDHDHAGAPRD